MVATLWMPTGILAGLSFFLFGAGPILWTISQTTLRQTVTPGALLGRVSALVMAATAGCARWAPPSAQRSGSPMDRRRAS